MPGRQEKRKESKNPQRLEELPNPSGRGQPCSVATGHCRASASPMVFPAWSRCQQFSGSPPPLKKRGARDGSSREVGNTDPRREPLGHLYAVGRAGTASAPRTAPPCAARRGGVEAAAACARGSPQRQGIGGGGSCTRVGARGMPRGREGRASVGRREGEVAARKRGRGAVRVPSWGWPGQGTAGGRVGAWPKGEGWVGRERAWCAGEARAGRCREAGASAPACTDAWERACVSVCVGVHARRRACRAIPTGVRGEPPSGDPSRRAAPPPAAVPPGPRPRSGRERTKGRKKWIITVIMKENKGGGGKGERWKDWKG